MLQKRAKEIIKQIENNSLLPIQNKELFECYILKSLVLGKPITFYNWECPPRRINIKRGKIFVDYDVNLRNIFLGKTIDAYTELPRVVGQCAEEISMLTFLKSLNFPFRFVKIIADTNAYYLTPESINISGKAKISKKFKEFKYLIKKQTAQYPVKTRVRFFTEVAKSFNGIYKDVYECACRILSENPYKLLPRKIFKEQILRTKTHVGISDKQWARDFSVKTIATYCAEGVVFALLAETKEFSNCVWLNNHEIDKRTIEITNCCRRKMDIGELPMIFWGG